MDYKSRRKRLMAAMPGQFMLFMGNWETPRNYQDNPYPFRQDSSFLYLFGAERPFLAATIDASSGKTTLYAKEPTLDDLIWTGPQTSAAELAAKAGIDVVKPFADLCVDLVREKRRIHYVPPYRHTIRATIMAFMQTNGNKENYKPSEDLIKAMVRLREVKDADEIAEMERHMAFGRAMHVAAMRMARSGATESEVRAAVEYEALKGGVGVSFPTICSVHGETLHNHSYNNVLRKGQLLLVDAGAESPLHYATDHTRTTAVDGEWSAQQKEVYQIVLDANNAAQAAIEPGITFQEVHYVACEVIVAGLKELGLMKGDTADAVQAGAQALFMPHGLGHLLGLDVHDMESYGEDLVGYDDEVSRNPLPGHSSLRLGKRLKEGFTLTDEPGIYFIPALIDKWQAEGRCKDFINYQTLDTYRNFGGIRLEDDILVTKHGSRLLGERLPIEIDDVASVTKDNGTLE